MKFVTDENGETTILHFKNLEEVAASLQCLGIISSHSLRNYSLTKNSGDKDFNKLYEACMINIQAFLEWAAPGAKEEFFGKNFL